MDSHMDFVREALDFDRKETEERAAWKARAERTITPPGPDALEAQVRAHLRTMLHGFVDWPEDEFQAAIDRNGSAVARHEQDHTAHPDDFTDVDDTQGLVEFAHEHKPGDPLRTWGGAPMTAAPLVDLRIATHRIRRVAANPSLPPDLRHRLEEMAVWLDLEVDRARPDQLVRKEMTE